MKQYVAKLGLLIFAMIAISACSKKSSNKGVAAGIVPGACVVGPGGACANGTPYFGAGGRWQGTLTIVNVALFNQMLMEQGMPQAMPQTFIGLSISLSQSQGRFAVSQAVYGQWRKVIQKNGQAYSSGVNGFNIVAQNYYFGGGITTLPYPQSNILPPQVNTSIQVASVFADAMQRVLSTSLIYRGQIIAQGQMQGTPNYNSGYGYQTSSYAPSVLPYTRTY